MLMDTLQGLHRKIKSGGDLLTVVRTMKSLAAANIHQYEQAVLSLNHYYKAVELGLRGLLYDRSIKRDDQKEKHRVAIIFGSDQGLAGQFNERISRFLRNSFPAADMNAEKMSIWVAGAKMAESITDSFGDYEELFLLPSSAENITTHVQKMLLRLERERQLSKTNLTLFYNAPEGVSSYKQVKRVLLPPDRQWLDKLGGNHWPGRGLPFYRSRWPEIFPAMIREYLFVSLFRGFAASMSAENAARLASMQRAEKNIREMLENFRVQYNSMRQEKISEELFELVAGFEALTAEDKVIPDLLEEPEK